MAVNESFDDLFYLTDSKLGVKNPRGTIYEIISVLNSFFTKTLMDAIKHIRFLNVVLPKKHVQMT